MNSGRLSHIELFAFDHQPSFTDRPVRPGSLYLLLKLSCGKQACYGECVISPDGEAFDVTKWGAYLRGIHHCNSEEIRMTVALQEQDWTTAQLTLLQSALSGMPQAGYAPISVATGSRRYEPQADTPVNRHLRDLPLCRLYEESVAYYSVLS